MALKKKPITKEIAISKLEALCSRSEQCEADIEKKMFTWGLSSSIRKEIIDYLKEERYVDNSRYARSFANDKARFSYWGPHKVRVELGRKRIAPQLIKEAIEQIDNNVWKEALLKNAVSKAKHLDLIGESGWENRQKLYRYLISRGFPSSAAVKAVNMMKKRQEEVQDGQMD